MSRELKTSNNETRRLPSVNLSNAPAVTAVRSVRARTAQNHGAKKSGKGMLFLKQCVAAAIIIFACVMINRSGLSFCKNCISALGRAVHWQFDFGAAWNEFLNFLGSIAEFWSDVF